MSYNPILDVDSYKVSHWKMLPKGSQVVNSYVEPRGGRYNRAIFFGLQMYLKEYLSNPITKENIQEAEELLVPHGEPFNREGWEYILNQYGGFLPLEIEAIPEGTVIEISNALMQVRNTDIKVPWITSYMETALLRAIWYPTTVCTISYMIKQLYKSYLEKTADAPETKLAFGLNDFGARGTSCFESSGIAGAAHMVNFLGSDTIEGIRAARRYYNETKMTAFSVPASEHSVTCAWGKENELKFFKTQIEQFGNGIVSLVSDTYNIYNAVENLFPQLKNLMIEKGGRVVIRPDSGNPVAVVSNVINTLMQKFGFTVNSKGYKVLPDYLRVIQGDGVNELSIRDILNELEMQKISAENVIFGMGGQLHMPNRDTMLFAQKASAVCINNEWKEIYKEPIGDNSKKSKKGVLSVVNRDGKFKTIKRSELSYGENDFLQPVWKNGELLVDWTFDEVKENTTK